MRVVTPDASAPIVRLCGVSKRFGDLAALDGVDLAVARGEVVVVIGPSGSGKSTLLRSINLLEVPDQGRIEIDGELVFERAAGSPRPGDRILDRFTAAARRKTAMVFQRFNLFPHLTVVENVTLGPMRAQGRTQAEAEETARALLARVGLSDKVTAYPNQLSGGQQQRVAIARALALSPEVMLFDEPTSALDPELVEEVLLVIAELKRDGMTKIIVTHEMEFAREVGDRVLVFDGGRVLEQGPPERIFSNPGHPRTRQFLRKVLRRGLVA
jgi:ABC-type polar amino acid transport system ATPase subunit